MSPTIGSGPLAQRPAGRFSPEVSVPDGLLYFEDTPRRIRAICAKQTIASSSRMKLPARARPPPRLLLPDSGRAQRPPRAVRTHRLAHAAADHRLHVDDRRSVYGLQVAHMDAIAVD